MNPPDVFLSYNPSERDAVREIALRLKDRGVEIWVDFWDLPPGKPWQPEIENALSQARSVAAFVGKDGLGPHQEDEVRAALVERVQRGMPVIPVILPTAPDSLELPRFLGMMVAVDFRRSDPDPLHQLVQGIVGVSAAGAAIRTLGNVNIQLGNISVNPSSGRMEPLSDADSLGDERRTVAISAEQAFERIGAATRQNLEQMRINIDQARSESSQFFKFTLIFSSLGFAIVASGITMLLVGQTTAGIVASISSLVPELTAALFFNKDRELRRTIEAYHNHIIDSQRLMTMIDLAETITDTGERDRMKQNLILKALRLGPKPIERASQEGEEESA